MFFESSQAYIFAEITKKVTRESLMIICCAQRQFSLRVCIVEPVQTDTGMTYDHDDVREPYKFWLLASVFLDMSNLATI